MTEKKTRVRRSAAEIMEAKRKEYEAAVAKVAAEKALEIDGISDLVESLDTARKSHALANRVFSGPQCIDNRRETYRLWNVEIDALEALSNANKDFAGTVADYFEAEIAKLVEIQTGENPLSDSDLVDAVSAVHANVPRNDEIDRLQADFDAAQAARKEFTEAKKAPKRAKKAESDFETETDEAEGMTES